MKNRKDLASLVWHPARNPLAVAGAFLAVLGFGSPTVHAHGFEGDYFFPPTIATDDPFATDELLLPSITSFKGPGDPATWTTAIGFEFDKEIFPKFALGIAGDEQFLSSAPGVPSANGWDNFTLSAKYQLWESAADEAIISIGGEWDIGGSGSQHVGVDSANTFTPTIYFGKGFGTLPDSVGYLRPIAITGTLGEDIPTEGEPNNLAWGLALEYNLPFLESEVKDIGLPHPLRDLIPLVEFSFSTPENRDGGRTTGTINPGVLYESKYYQAGVEAIIPLNRASGHGVGVTFQLEIFIDDIFPDVFGHPLFGHDE
jgi:hypothetical protein